MKSLVLMILLLISLSKAYFLQRDSSMEEKVYNLTNIKKGELSIEEFEEKRI